MRPVIALPRDGYALICGVENWSRLRLLVDGSALALSAHRLDGVLAALRAIGIHAGRQRGHIHAGVGLSTADARLAVGSSAMRVQVGDVRLFFDAVIAWHDFLYMQNRKGSPDEPAISALESLLDFGIVSHLKFVDPGRDDSDRPLVCRARVAGYWRRRLRTC